jgi:hypothetical protein
MSELVQKFAKTTTFKYFYSTLMRFDADLNCFVSTSKLRDRDAELLTAAWWMFQEQQTKIDGLKNQLSRIGYVDNGGQLMKPPVGNIPNFDLLDHKQAKIDELQKWIDGALGIAQIAISGKGNSVAIATCRGLAREIEKALRGGDQNTKNKAQSIENIGYEGGDQKAQQSETAPVPKWSTIKVVCQRCGHYLNGCHCNHFGDQCPHLNTSKFGDDGLAECFNCNKIINKDREVVGGADDINLTR